MIIFLLLVIIAILLFGSSAVLGVIGAILGFIALVLALFFGAALAASAIGVALGDFIMYVCLGLLGLGLFVRLASWLLSASSRKRRHHKSTTEHDLRGDAECQAALQRQAMFNSPAPNKAEKRARRRQVRS